MTGAVGTRAERRPNATRRRARRHDLAVHAPFSGHVYTEEGGRAVDGAEFQAAKLAQTLAAEGLRVCHIVFDDPSLNDDHPSGVRLIRQAPDQLERGRAAYARSLYEALSEADSSVYVQRTAGFETGLVGTFAATHRRPFVFSSSSTTDLAKKPPLPNWRTILSYRVGRRLADDLVVQTTEQVALARQSLGRDAHLIRSFCDSRTPAGAPREAFIWLGGLIDYKGPLAYLRLAELVPEAHFWMIGTRRDSAWDALADEVSETAERLPNVTMLPPRGRHELFELYDRTIAVVNTSAFEGFPNTFMEGWSSGAAALSLNVDPDGVIRRHGLGAVARGDIGLLAESARHLWNARSELEDVSANARRYIAENHDPSVIGARWADLIARLA